MEELENRRAVELVKNLHGAKGVVAYAKEELFVVSYPQKAVEPLFGFTKRDLERAIELKRLRETTEILRINGKECPAYMKTAGRRGSNDAIGR
jgi:hypothetical protein